MDAPSETVWGTKVKPGGKVNACAVREMRGEGSFCPAVAARAALVREGRTALFFFAARAIPVAGGGWRTLGLVRALGYADHMSTHSRSFPAPRRGALHEEQAPQEADREEKKRSAPRRRSGGKASPEQSADRQGPSRRSGRRVSGEPAAQAPARARPGSRSRCSWPVAGPTCPVRPCPKKISACRWRRVTTCSPCWKSWGTASSPCVAVWCWPGARSPRPGPRTSGRNRAGSPSPPSAAGHGSSRPCSATGGRTSPPLADMCGVCASCRSSCPTWRHGPCTSARPPRPRRWGPSPCGKKT